MPPQGKGMAMWGRLDAADAQQAFYYVLMSPGIIKSFRSISIKVSH